MLAVSFSNQRVKVYDAGGPRAVVDEKLGVRLYCKLGDRVKISTLIA